MALINVSKQTPSGAPTEHPPLCLLPGMTFDFPVYSRMQPLLRNMTVVEFLEPEPRESLPHYAARMAEKFTPHCFIGGVSFGGILALEISRLLKPRGCILISSIRVPDELPPWLRIWRIPGGCICGCVLKLAGDLASIVPKPVRRGSIARMAKLSGSGGMWHRWASSVVLDWHPSKERISFPLIHIHGDSDTTFPVRYVTPDVIISGGQHALPMSHPQETADAISAFMNSNS